MTTISQGNGHFQFLNILGAIVFDRILGLMTMIPLVRADSINPGVYPIDSKPYGSTYADWTVKWWQWALGIPKDSIESHMTTLEKIVLRDRMTSMYGSWQGQAAGP